MRLLWLPTVLREWGLTVVEQPGWRTRGVEFGSEPLVAIGHHTATPTKVPGDLPTLRILRDGRSDLPGPLCQVAVSRSGVAHVIASGKANHAGAGAWQGVQTSSLTVGCEVEHPGTGPWEPAQLRAFDRVMAALLDGLGRSAQSYCGHREWALPKGRKVDPGGVDLPLQRDRIARLLDQGPVPHREDAEMNEQDWTKLNTLLDDKLRLVLRGEGKDGKPTGHPNLADLTRRMEAIEQALGNGQ